MFSDNEDQDIKMITSSFSKIHFIENSSSCSKEEDLSEELSEITSSFKKINILKERNSRNSSKPNLSIGVFKSRVSFLKDSEFRMFFDKAEIQEFLKSNSGRRKNNSKIRMCRDNI